MRLKNTLFCMLQKPLLICIIEVLQMYMEYVNAFFFFWRGELCCLSNLPHILIYLLPQLLLTSALSYTDPLPKLKKSSLSSIQIDVGVGQVLSSKRIID